MLKERLQQVHRKIGIKLTADENTFQPGLFLMIDKKTDRMLFTIELVQDLKTNHNIDVIEKIIEVIDVPGLSKEEMKDLHDLIRKQDWI